MRRLRGCASTLLTLGLLAIMAGLFFDGRFDVPILWFRDSLAAGEPVGCARGAGRTSDSSPIPVVLEPVEASDSDVGLWYEALGEQPKRIYGPLLEGLRSREQRLVLEDCTTDDVERAYWAIRGDHPEIFWLGGYSYGETFGAVVIEPEFVVPHERIDEVQAAIDEQVGDVLQGLGSDASTYERVRRCFEWIVEQTDYAYGDNDQTIVGVFVDHEAVCAGYARAFQYLLAKQGIRCDYVIGQANGRGNHGWNIVWIDGTPTYVDVTWGDPTFVGDDGTFLPGDVILYDYLCITTDEISRDHLASEPADVLPNCDSTAYDYYRLNGTYLESFSALDLRELVSRAVADGKTSLRFKMGSQEAYDEALAFVSSQEVFRCFDERLDGLTYVNQDVLHVIALDWGPEIWDTIQNEDLGE